jgi:hypothetical protein
VLGCCVVSTLYLRADINLDALIVYANGIFIMIYLLCMLAGCRLLKDAIGTGGGGAALPAAAGDGGLEEPVRAGHAGGLWLFLPKRSASAKGPVGDATGQNRGDRLYGPDGRAVHPYAGIPLQRYRPPALKPPPASG